MQLLQCICKSYSNATPITSSTVSYDVKFYKDELNYHMYKANCDRQGNVKTDAYLQRKKNIGLKKKTGNISLNSLYMPAEQKTFMRDYCKIKFQYVLHFDIADIYDIGGKISPDEFTLTKSHHGVGEWSVIIKNNKK